jgi:hypothetical protein
MTPELLKKQLYSVYPRGKFGYTKADKLGLRTYEQALATNPHAGFFRVARIKGKKVVQQMKFYKPPCPFTPAQKIYQDKFAQAVIAYRLLSPDEKRKYKIWGSKYHMTEYNKFISEYMKTH